MQFSFDPSVADDFWNFASKEETAYTHNYNFTYRDFLFTLAWCFQSLLFQNCLMPEKRKKKGCHKSTKNTTIDLRNLSISDDQLQPAPIYRNIPYFCLYVVKLVCCTFVVCWKGMDFNLLRSVFLCRHQFYLVE